VIVEIPSGGYVWGDKNTVVDPIGLIKRSQQDDSFEIVYVTINYRLGLFSWLAGEAYQAQGGVSNLVLLDQRLALEWVQLYTHLFEGDKASVTNMGGLAGGKLLGLLHLGPRCR
jgi:carboxylesterase type B